MLPRAIVRSTTTTTNPMRRTWSAVGEPNQPHLLYNCTQATVKYDLKLDLDYFCHRKRENHNIFVYSRNSKTTIAISTSKDMLNPLVTIQGTPRAAAGDKDQPHGSR